MITTAQLKPGDVVQHPEKGHGIVHRRFARNGVGVMYADKDRDGIDSFTTDPTGWERAETVRPGHVQVRVDDLDLSRWEERGDNPQEHPAATAASRAAKAIAAQRAESTPPADEPERDEKPTSTTVTLPCPDCGKEITRTAEVWTGIRRDHILAWATTEWHTCKPAQPDEPTEFGARVTVDGEQWLRVAEGDSAWPWQNGSRDCQAWGELLERGTVTLGWDE